MAKGLEKHQARVGLLNSFGKELTRRSGAKCELCEASGVPLAAFPVPPEEEELTADACVFCCDVCRGELEHPKRMRADHWRVACQTVWSEVPAVQVMAARVLDRLSRSEMWAREALDDVYLEEEVEEWIARQPL